MGYAWTAQLDLVARDAMRSALRGIGPPKQSAAFPLRRIQYVHELDAAWNADRPLGPRDALVVGLW